MSRLHPNTMIVGGREPIIEGARSRPCAECGAVVWLAPSSMPYEVQGLPVICLDCALRMAEAVRGEGGESRAEFIEEEIEHVTEGGVRYEPEEEPA